MSSDDSNNTSSDDTNNMGEECNVNVNVNGNGNSNSNGNGNGNIKDNINRNYNNDDNHNDVDVGNKKRNVKKPLPADLLNVTEEDYGKFICGIETPETANGVEASQERNVVKFFVTEGCEVDLSKLTNALLRNLCRRLGVKNAHRRNKFQCREAMADRLDYLENVDMYGINPRKIEARARNSLLRATNAVFSSSFVEQFLRLNDKKSRSDHETKELPSAFWTAVTEAYNDFGSNKLVFSELQDELSVVVNNRNDTKLDELISNKDLSLDLDSVDNLTVEFFKKKIMTLIKIRRQLIKNMTQSGTHSNEAFDFVKRAMETTPGGRTFNRLAVYYFYVRAQERGKDIDAAFEPFMKESLKGSTFTALDSPVSDIPTK